MFMVWNVPLSYRSTVAKAAIFLICPESVKKRLKAKRGKSFEFFGKYSRNFLETP